MKTGTIITIQLIFGLISTIYIVYSFYRDIEQRKEAKRLGSRTDAAVA